METVVSEEIEVREFPMLRSQAKFNADELHDALNRADLAIAKAKRAYGKLSPELYLEEPLRDLMDACEALIGPEGVAGGQND